MRQLLPTADDPVDVRQAYRVGPGQAWLRANMVATIDGAVTDPGGRSRGISGEPDRRVFRVLRELADAVVVGARTAQAERYRRSSVPVVLVSRTLDLDLTTPVLASRQSSGMGPTVVVAPESAPSSRRTALLAHARRVGGIEVVFAGAAVIDLGSAVAQLRDRGLDHLLCEGGPSLLAALVAGGLVDELCLTTSPRVVGGAAGRIVAGGSALPATSAWRLHALYEDEDFLFTRWRPPGPP